MEYFIHSIGPYETLYFVKNDSPDFSSSLQAFFFFTVTKFRLQVSCWS
jgi:hypothetical protein